VTFNFNYLLLKSKINNIKNDMESFIWWKVKGGILAYVLHNVEGLHVVESEASKIDRLHVLNDADDLHVYLNRMT
jgi:hypothetical protein